MSSVKVAVIYYSSTGTNYQLAEWAKEGAVEAGAEVKVLKVKELAPEAAIESNPAWKQHVEETQHVPEVSLHDLEWADVYIFSSPTRYGNIPSQLQQFFDTTGGLWFQGKLANKVVTGMASASNSHGGQEQTIQSIYKTMMHWGAIIVPAGYTDDSIFAAGGNPYGTSVTIDQEGNMIENVEAAVKHQAKRTVSIAKSLQ
ncbi:NAD(P)H:quinone oxidoreductase, type IV [Bacillus coahuilensis p1.1.43]|uniref:NAD(P)H:quinone oxidoreductase, type IV n=1 Tax=Bacillus coahuilensis p1.1.43 TaxID=1150625 RepID=A0A147KB10_9BACI|nr:NAD(P)H:quinone oxidoreductase [Bacillus coahuilensis]KUP08065.1 NAD(P)H:quinone oxidoreductase, type IV [Bacillus coahuilensis p1.1.43]